MALPLPFFGGYKVTDLRTDGRTNGQASGLILEEFCNYGICVTYGLVTENTYLIAGLGFLSVHCAKTYLR
jgi:hypothetical protein